MPHKKATAELYDLAADPSETSNVFREQPEIAGALLEKITNIVCHGRTTPGAVQTNDTGHWKDLTWIEPVEYESKQGERTPR